MGHTARDGIGGSGNELPACTTAPDNVLLAQRNPLLPSRFLSLAEPSLLA
jgi:hypothetical protein